MVKVQRSLQQEQMNCSWEVKKQSSSKQGNLQVVWRWGLSLKAIFNVTPRQSSSNYEDCSHNDERVRESTN